MRERGRVRRQSRTSERALSALIHRIAKWAHEKLPPGIRTLLGLVLLIAGAFGILPILGFWMIPLGALLIALDIPPLRRKIISRLRDRAKTQHRD